MIITLSCHSKSRATSTSIASNHRRIDIKIFTISHLESTEPAVPAPVHINVPGGSAKRISILPQLSPCRSWLPICVLFHGPFYGPDWRRNVFQSMFQGPISRQGTRCARCRYFLTSDLVQNQTPPSQTHKHQKGRDPCQGFIVSVSARFDLPPRPPSTHTCAPRT